MDHDFGVGPLELVGVMGDKVGRYELVGFGMKFGLLRKMECPMDFCK